MTDKKNTSAGKKAVVLLSGGMDSAVTLYCAKERGFSCLCLIFDYGQRHAREIGAAKKIAKAARCPREVIEINLPWKGSALLDRNIALTGAEGRRRRESGRHIPATYVPARNTIFLSFALSFAEAVSAQAIFIGAHVHDYSGYPDCRPEFFRAFGKLIGSGTKAGAEGRTIRIAAPLINKTKAEIIKLGQRLGVPFQFTWSCYRGGREPCGRCDSCYFRAGGFRKLGIEDPLLRI